MIKHQLFLGAGLAALTLGATLLGSGKASADQVIPDDLIVQGSLCVGLDCVNNESFGFDTIRLKENNTRIKFDDTSVSAGFPANDWQLTANDSASGGLNKFSIEDVTGSKVPFTVEAGAATNSIFVDSTGRVGFRTATPVLDLHVNTSNTPGLRLEQNNSGGFTAQTWDVAGNEANFFVRDVTGGSLLSFRIRPGAPTSSIDISSSGNVGMRTASPQTLLHVGSVASAITNSWSGTVAGVAVNSNVNRSKVQIEGTGSADLAMVDTTAGANDKAMLLRTDGGITRFLSVTDAFGVVIDNVLVMRHTNGNVGIGAATPAAQLHTTGSVRFAGVANCGSGIQSNASGDLSCLASSRQFKNVTGDLPPGVALANVMALRPQTGSFKDTPDVPEHWLIAEEVEAIDPALVGLRAGKPYVVKTQNIVADLVAVVQQQQRQIEELRRLVSTRP